jgi:soluble lytic murein transglycosylase
MAAAEVYVKYLNGVPYFTDAPRDEGFKKIPLFSERLRRVPYRLGSVRLPDRYRQTIQAIAEKYGIDPALVLAVIKSESDFDPHAVSTKGALGLMQLMPGTAYDMGVTDVLDPRENIEGGTRYLKFLLGMFEGDLDRSIAAYNAGQDAVMKYGDIPPYQETQEYVRRVRHFYGIYRDRPVAAKRP